MPTLPEIASFHADRIREAFAQTTASESWAGIESALRQLLSDLPAQIQQRLDTLEGRLQSVTAQFSAAALEPGSDLTAPWLDEIVSTICELRDAFLRSTTDLTNLLVSIFDLEPAPELERAADRAIVEVEILAVGACAAMAGWSDLHQAIHKHLQAQLASLTA